MKDFCKKLLVEDWVVTFLSIPLAEEKTFFAVEIKAVAKGRRQGNAEIDGLEEHHIKHHHDDEETEIQYGMIGRKSIVHSVSFI
ncbi:MAG: hypothetical protein IIY02_03430 [Firmicutes bacterium]|nr:hypothetical protein [Bacillota bacterium]